MFWFVFFSLASCLGCKSRQKINVENRSVFIHIKKNLVFVSISGTKTDFQIYPENENDSKIM